MTQPFQTQHASGRSFTAKGQPTYPLTPYHADSSHSESMGATGAVSALWSASSTSKAAATTILKQRTSNCASLPCTTSCC